MGSAAKENSVEFSGILPSAFAEANRNAAKSAANNESIGSRRALAPKPANASQKSFNSPHKVEKRHNFERKTEGGTPKLHGEWPSTKAKTNPFESIPSLVSRTKKPRLNVMEEHSGDEDTEDESSSAGALTPLTNLAARRTHSRSKALYPRPQIPKDLGTLELDFVTAPKEPSLDDYTKAFFETLTAQHPPPQATPSQEITMDDFPDLELDISSGEEDESIAELKTPSH